ncbi:hypothetical protein C1645_830688 [Glomus cerebriforme]|uniref:Uncharacterized protein n=1 Tax=Glomus cerebriforme TaxID=658196 RepID=A0A397SKW5_9GLOM|nr:hypothetical protein C1645_830688 [Glomus cerebriforme]
MSIPLTRDVKRELRFSERQRIPSVHDDNNNDMDISDTEHEEQNDESLMHKPILSYDIATGNS